MSDLPDFLLARIAEDEEIARKATPGPWHHGEHDDDRLGDTGLWGKGRAAGPWGRTLVATHTWPQEAAHMIRWDPAHVLAECEAKRRIVELHAPTKPEVDRDPDLRVELSRCTADWELFPCPTLRLLALPYADHEGYRAEWKP